MSPRAFDRFMVSTQIGTNRKLRRLNPAERWCFVAGVLPIAAMSPIRGCLIVGRDEAEARDYAEQSGVTVAVVRSTLQKLRDVGMVYANPDMGCEVVHDFEDWNPPPKKDPTNAERQRRYRERHRNAPSSNGVTPGREEKEEGNNGARALAAVRDQQQRWDKEEDDQGSQRGTAA
jgi:hypothetical protein